MIESVEMVIRQPGFPDRVVALHEGATRIGRSEDNEVVLSDVGVSRRHAQVYWSGDECLIEDLGSGNGTYHSGQRVQSQPLSDGDEVVIDPFVVTFKISGGAPAASSPSDAGNAGARLEVIVGTGMAGSSYPITARGLTIGRAEDRDVVIPDPAASRHHCSILAQGDRYALRDMGSANGVYVNAVRVREQPLEDGDIVRIGNTEMRFVRSATGQLDTTTQVNPADVFNQPGYTGQAVVPQQPAPVARSGGSSAIWLWLTAMMTMAGFGMLVVLGAAGAWYVLAYEAPPSVIPARAPAWTLDLPGGLEGGTTDSMFKSGVAKMKKEDHRGALQDFYRVLQADPGGRNAKKFALAAGEVVVLEQLEEWLVDEAKARRDHEARRSLLLGRVRRGGRVGRTAEATLKEEFREDPIVIKEMGWTATDAMKKREAAVAAAAQALAGEQYAEAVGHYEIVLAGSDDGNVRVQALAGLKTCRRELARSVAEPWRAASVAAVQGRKTEAAAGFAKVKAADPTNPCAALQPR